LKTDELHNTRYDCLYTVVVATRHKRQILNNAWQDDVLKIMSDSALGNNAEVVSVTLASNLLEFEIIVPPSRSVTKTVKNILKLTDDELVRKFPDDLFPKPMFARTMQVVTMASRYNKPSDAVNYLNGIKRYYRDKEGSYI
jgi:REP element-mobilizing transposase RayT